MAFCSLSRPRLSGSMLSFRLQMVRKRLSSYPMDRLDFILMDLERPESSSRHAHWCTGDCTGRTLEFLSYSQEIDGYTDPRAEELFLRMLRQKRKSGLFGRWAASPAPVVPEQAPLAGTGKEFPAFLRYYAWSGDMRALEAARGIGDYVLAHKDAYLDILAASGVNRIEHWNTEPFALLYEATGDKRYLEMVADIRDRMGDIRGAHSHGFLTTLRGLQQAAIITGDRSWNELPERFRRKIMEEGMETADGGISECFPRSSRNEGCSIADWLMLNLNAGYLNADDSAYEKAEHILYNALFFNQILTGGLIHRQLLPLGYGASEVQEAWWCCTQTGGLAMAMTARHGVTQVDNTIRVNFLLPGEFRLPYGITVHISTSWPKSPEAIIRIDNLPAGMRVHVRAPAGVKDWACTQEKAEDGGCVIRTRGRLGHYLEQAAGGLYTLKYGPMILAPTVYKWGHGTAQLPDSTVPEGYVPLDFPSMACSIVEPAKTKDGFLDFPHLPLPDWSYFEEGPQARADLGEASVHVPLAFADGTVKEARFWPLCQTFSSLCFYETPLLFQKG